MAAKKTAQSERTAALAARSTRRQRVPGSIYAGNQANKDPHPELAWLDSKHPVYVANVERWKLNEARLQGGDNVISELQPFDWEKLRGVGSNYLSRQNQAVYPNFGDDFLTVIMGHLFKYAPTPDAGLNFGTMGEVRRENRGGGKPSRAELIYYSVDSPGFIGTPWNAWWLDLMKRAGATGHRWVYCETPSEAPKNRAEEVTKGLRPYLVEYSPIDVPMWNFGLDGRLNFAVLKFLNEEAQLAMLNFPQKDNITTRGVSLYTLRKDYLLVVRAGFRGLGPAFEAGGWFKFDPMKDLYDQGDFLDLDGEVGVFPVFYERSKGSATIPAISRPGITELGNCSVAYMNLLSAANFDAWDAAKSTVWLQGVDDAGYQLAVDKKNAGSQWIPLPPNEDTDAVPQVSHGAAGAVAHQVMTTRLRGLELAAVKLGQAEATAMTSSRGATNPNTHTGASKAASFNERQVPRILHVARNLDMAQNIAIDFLERRFGGKTPTGQANWPQKMDLIELVEKLQSFFEVERIAGIRSATLDAKAMRMVAEQKGLVSSDDEANAVEKEYKKSAKTRDLLEQQQALMVDSSIKSGPIPQPKPGKGATPPQSSRTAAKQAARNAKNKAGKGGKKVNPGPR